MKVKFTIQNSYEIELPNSLCSDYGNVVDYISVNCYDLIDQNKAKCVSESLIDVKL